MASDLLSPRKIGPYLTGPGAPPDYGVYTGMFEELSVSIPDHAVHLIFTDPVYQLPGHYKALAQLANRVLLPDRALLAYFGLGFARETIVAAFEGGRDLTWIGGEYQPGPRRGGQYHFSHWHGLLWLGGKAKRHFVDMLPTHGDYGAGYNARAVNTKRRDKSTTAEHILGEADDQGHEWRKAVGPAKKWIAAFTDPGEVVLDTHCGGGAILEACIQTGRRYIGFEIKPSIARACRARLAKVVYQPPLNFDLPATQMSWADLASEGELA